MIELLLAAQLSCAEGYHILDGIETSAASRVIKEEAKVEVRAEMPSHCHRENDKSRPRRGR